MKNIVITLLWAALGLILTNQNAGWGSIAISIIATVMVYKNLKGILYGK